MTPTEFFNNLIGLYRRARIPTFEDTAIYRHRCRAVSGGLEDLLAYYICRNHANKYLVYVDQYLNLGAKQVMYADILLLERATGQICHFLDAKTDLGWSSEGLEQLSCHFKRQVERAKAVALPLMDENGNIREFSVSQDAKCHIVVATRANGRGLNPAKLRIIEAECGVNVFVLSEEKHPNSFSFNSQAEYPSKYINLPEFDRLYSALR